MKYLTALKNNKYLLIAFSMLVVISLTKNYFDAQKKPVSTDSTIDIATSIPKGHVLLPLEFSNHENLSSLIKDFGVIDLYSVSTETGKKTKIVENVKILRAPYNPHLFAVLVKEEFSEAIMKQSGSFEGVVQNLNNNQPMSLKTSLPPKLKSIAVDYQNGQDY